MKLRVCATSKYQYSLFFYGSVHSISLLFFFCKLPILSAWNSIIHGYQLSNRRLSNHTNAENHFFGSVSKSFDWLPSTTSRVFNPTWEVYT